MSIGVTVSASILSANFLTLEQEIQAIQAAGVDALHLDIMDNHFVPNISFGPSIISAVRAITTLPLDAHLMITSPGQHLDAYIDSGVNDIGIHLEAYDTHAAGLPPSGSSLIATHVDVDALHRDMDHIKRANVRAGIVVNPLTPIDILTPLITVADFVLVMSVHPGFSGQSFLPSTIDRVRTLRGLFSGDIRIDGGVDGTNAAALIDAGATQLISASYLFGSTHYADAVATLRHPE